MPVSTLPVNARQAVQYRSSGEFQIRQTQSLGVLATL